MCTASVILAATQSFFDERLEHPGDIAQFHRLELLGERAVPLFGEPDAGIWEFRATETSAYPLGGHVLGGLRPSGAHRHPLAA